MNRRRPISLALVVLAGAVIIGCGSNGDLAIPSDIGHILDQTASRIPEVSEAPQPDQPGSAPAAIAGTLTIHVDEEQGDGQGGLSNHTTFVGNVKLKLSPDTTSDDLASGLAEYVDDGSTWTFTGQVHTWSEGGASGCPVDEVGEWDDSGDFQDEARYVTAATSGEGDFDWNLHLELSAQDARGTNTLTICGDADTNETDAGGGYIFCDALWQASAVFDFNDNCDQEGPNGLTDVSGTLQGSQ